MCAAGAFLWGSDGPFNVWDVLVLATDVQLGVKMGGDGPPRTFELAITQDVGNAESTPVAHAMDLLEGLCARVSLAVGKDSTGDNLRWRETDWKNVRQTGKKGCN